MMPRKVRWRSRRNAPPTSRCARHLAPNVRSLRNFGQIFAMCARSSRCRCRSAHSGHGGLPFWQPRSPGRSIRYAHRIVHDLARAPGANLRQGVVAGQSAAALHGAKWVDARRPAEMLWQNRRPPTGIHAWSDGFATDEVELIDGMRVTTPARTALDLACRYPLGKAVAVCATAGARDAFEDR